jgi:hypothetical protein
MPPGWFTIKNQIQIEKLKLLDAVLDSHLLEAFSKYEVEDPQFGISWLTNMASYALNADEQAVLYVARLSVDNFVVLPIKLNTRSLHAQSLSTFYTSTYSPVVCSGTPEILFLALFQHLARVEKIATISIYPMDSNSPSFGVIQRVLLQAGWKGIHRYFCFGNWIHELGSASYQSYLASRPTRLRNTIVRRTRQYLDADRGSIRIVQGGDTLESAIEEYVAIYKCSWKREEPYPEFVPQLLRLAASRGWLRLGIATYDKVPVAAQIWLVSQGTAFIFKLAYHEQYKQLSPGTVLTAYLVEHVIDKDSVSRIDYLSGDDDYKTDWMSVRRERHGVAAYNPCTLRGSAVLVMHTLNALIKKIRAGLLSTNAPAHKG